MKRIIAICLMCVLMTMNLASVKVQALPVAVAASSASVMAMIVGLLPYLGVLFNSETERQNAIAKAEEMVSDEMGKTNVNVQAIADFTSANDSNADNGTILQNFLSDNAVMMQMQTGTGDNYVQTYFTGVGQAQLFIKAVLAMCASMLVHENVETYYEGVAGTGYMSWSGFPASPANNSSYPYQAIYNISGGHQLLCYTGKLDYDGSTLYSRNASNGVMYDLHNGVWSYPYSWTGNRGFTTNSIDECNYAIYTSESYSTVYKAKTTTSIQDGNSVQTQVMNPSIVGVADQTTGIWTGSASIAVPSEAVAYDVMDGTKTVSDVISTYTAEGAIPMTGTIAETIAGTVTAPAEVGEWSKENWTVPSLILTKFPFCIPWDITNTFSSMIAESEPPKWEIDFPDNIFIGGGSMTIDFAQFETLAKIVRWGVMISFLIGLMLLSWKLKGS